jgi:hypothetical protein
MPPDRKPPRAVVLLGVDVLHNEQTPPGPKDPGQHFVPSTTPNTPPRINTPTGSPQTPATPPTGSFTATQVVCVAYTDEFSIDNNSLTDLHVGCTHGVVSSNQTVLDRATSGSLAIVTSQSRHFVIGILGDSTERCNVWSSRGGHVFKYTRLFTPITDILPIASIRSAWIATCEIHEVSKDPMKLFHSRFCGYGLPYITALKIALNLGIIPARANKGTHILFE